MVSASVLAKEKEAAAAKGGAAPKAAPTPAVTPTPAPAPAPAPAAKAKKEVIVDEGEEIELTPELKKELERIEAEERDQPEVGPDQDDDRDHLNVIFVGHVDAGKSTLSGQVLLRTGEVQKKDLEKYEREAKDKGRESWFLAYIMDTNEEERARGKTVEVGRAHFQTDKRRYTILDAPGHKNYVPNMIGGASQADVAVLVISARRGEFETGFERGGQTNEHARLVRTAGVRFVVVAINKMDEATVQWSKERYDTIVEKLTAFLRQTGFNRNDVTFLPVSGISAANIKDPIPDGVAPWYKGDTLLSTLDAIKLPDRDPNAPVRMPVVDRYRDMGALFLMGKIEGGTVVRGSKLMLMPSRDVVEIVSIRAGKRNVSKAGPGENVDICIKGSDEENIHVGFVLCDPKKPVPVVSVFEAQVVLLELLETCPIFTTGYQCVIHIHSATEECTVKVMLALIDKKTMEVTQKRPKFAKEGQIVRLRLETARPVAIETFKDYPQLGRFTLRDSGKTIAIGKVLATAKKAD